MGIPATESVAGVPQEEETPRPRGKKDKDFHGRSPLQIAVGRLLRDPVAVICGVIVLFLVVAGIFAPLINDALQISGSQGEKYSLDNVTATDFDGLPIVGPPLGDFTWDHPLGIAPEHRRRQPGPAAARPAHLAAHRHARHRRSAPWSASSSG